MEYYIERWLRIAGNHIGKTIKVDIATLLTSWGKFARVRVEIDLNKPLMAGYVMRREYYRLQYEWLHDLCFGCGRYGHRDATCPEKQSGKEIAGGESSKEPAVAGVQLTNATTEDEGPSYGEWTTVKRSHRWPMSMVKGNSVDRSGGRIVWA